MIAAFIGVVLLMLTGYIGGSIFYHHDAGVDPKTLVPEIRAGHSHQYGHPHSRQPSDRTHDDSTTHEHDSR